MLWHSRPRVQPGVEMGWLNWLFGQGGAADGSSPTAAIRVGSVREEYEWVGRNLPGFELQMQALAHVGGKPFDVLTLRGPDGTTRQVYFDISSFFGQ